MRPRRCSHCGYDITGEPPGVRCPECGQAGYDASELPHPETIGRDRLRRVQIGWWLLACAGAIAAVLTLWYLL